MSDREIFSAGVAVRWLRQAGPGGDRAVGATPFTCRPGCGACCIAPSISSPLPGLPGGKPAGVPCPHLDEALRCRLFDDARRPAVCRSLQPSRDMCGATADEAMRGLEALERATRPGSCQDEAVTRHAGGRHSG